MISIVSFDPTSGAAGAQVQIRLAGMTEDFTVENTKVYIGEERLHDVDAVEPGTGTISVAIDEMARTGPFSVQGGENSEYTTAAANFTVDGSDSATPTITSITGDRSGGGMARFKPGETATVNGRNLAAVHKVSVGGTPTMIQAKAATRLRFRIPNITAANYYVSIEWGEENNTARFGRQIQIFTD